MPEPTKTNDQILAEQAAFKAAYERARAHFKTIEGVVGVGFGLKERRGAFSDDLAILVFVKEKKAEESVPAGQLIPASFEGYATDVCIVPQIRFLEGTRYNCIQGGIQITNAGPVTPSEDPPPPGTLGCVVRRRNNLGRDNVYVLSCHHVMQGDGRGPGDVIYHPNPPTAGPGSVALGPIQEGGFIGHIGHPPGAKDPIQTFIDCAIARLDIDCKCWGSACTKDVIPHSESIIDLKQVTPPESDMTAPQNAANAIADVRNCFNDLTFVNSSVIKVGNRTGKTNGKVVRVDGPVEMENPMGPPDSVVIRHNVIQIFVDESQGDSRFAAPGDSGSLVLDDKNRAVGLLFGADKQTGKFGIACHIVPVLDHLKICIPCIPSGKSHGSTHAEDGSGLAPSTRPSGNTAALSGQIAFTSQTVKGPLTVPPPLTDGEIGHMHEVLAEFRATPLGPELHEVFAEVRREVGYLVRNCRPVTVAWHRHQGPAFLVHVLNHLAGHSPIVPHEVKGVTRRALLERMRVMLTVHGSHPLRAALAKHGDDLIEVLTVADTARDAITALRENQGQKVPE
jgi:hypothetical protein